MSYRICVEQAAAQRLRTYSPHVVQRLGRLLADLAELASAPAPSHPSLVRNPPAGPRLFRIEVDEVSIWYAIDAVEETLTVVEVGSRAEESPGAGAEVM
jgi:hypothetical protein